MASEGIYEVETCIPCHYNTTTHYIATCMVLELCLVVEQGAGARVERRWWGNGDLDLNFFRAETRAMEAELESEA